MRKRRLAVGAIALLTVVSIAFGLCVFGESETTRINLTATVSKEDDRVEINLGDYTQHTGTVAFQGPVMTEGNENWKPAHSYVAVSLKDLVQAVGGMEPGDTLQVAAIDGYSKTIPYNVVYEETPAGLACLAIAEDGVVGLDWEDSPVLLFLPDDKMFSNEDMLTAFGEEFAHYYIDTPSTTGLQVKNVTFLTVVGDEDRAPAATDSAEPEGTKEPVTGEVLTVVVGGTSTTYSITDLEMLEVVSAPATFTNSASVDYTANYTGIPLITLIGNAPSENTVRVTASDGYSMNYEAGMLADRSSGTWILAYKENGLYLPFDPGYLRIVQVGEDNPHFTSSLSARMVEKIELLGEYEPYELVIDGPNPRTFSRQELEAGIGCPCHTSTVTVTGKGETHTYTGLPLWRLVAYADDERFPPAEKGIHYDNDDFNAGLAQSGYTITLVAEDEYAQVVGSEWIPGDERFIVAFKRDGIFLDPEKDGYMRFVYDDSVELPEGTRPKSVKFLSKIILDL